MDAVSTGLMASGTVNYPGSQSSVTACSRLTAQLIPSSIHYHSHILFTSICYALVHSLTD